MYGDMAAIAWVELTDGGGTKVPLRIIDILRVEKHPAGNANGSMVFIEGKADPLFVAETTAQVYTAINQKWTDWLAAFPA